MMDYVEFKEIFTQTLMDALPPLFAGYTPQVNMVPKVNEQKEALTLQPPKTAAATTMPTIYLDDMYRQYQEDGDFDEIIAQALGIIIRFTGFPLPELDELNFQNKTDRIVMNLISTEKNAQLLETIPHREFLDLSVIYRFILCREGNGFGTVILNNEILEDLHLSPEELHQLAYKNTLEIFPHVISEPIGGFYMMSNDHSVGGAATMACSECMTELAGKIGQDFYIIPASIHEIYAVPAENRSTKDLVCLLEEGNRLHTPDSEVLSSSIYHYNFSTGEISIAASYVAM